MSIALNQSTQFMDIKALQTLESFGIQGPFIFDKTLTSAVTTAWGVEWDEKYIARDLMQNFFDANRSSLDQVLVNDVNRNVMVSAPAQFNLTRLFYLGSEKGDESIGQYGEGFKAAAVCLLRDQGVTPIAVSGRHMVVLRISNEKIHGTDLSPVVYDYYTLAYEMTGAALILPGCSHKLVDAMKKGLSNFFYEQNELLGALQWCNSDFSVYKSNTSVGHVFYRNLKRGEIEGIPLVLVINKKYQNIENKINKDRDRNVFGEEVMTSFFKIFAAYAVKYSEMGQAQIVSSARDCWTRGHPLLHAIADTRSYRSSWSKLTTERVFGVGAYYAIEGNCKDPAEAIAIREMERKWREGGKTALPGYFKHFGVLNARSELRRIETDAREEAQKRNQRRPSAREEKAIKLLNEVLNEMAPEIVAVFSKSLTNYFVINSNIVLGQLKSGRSYRSRDVFLADSIFVGDFPAAVAVYLHEHAHIFGIDGSRGFTDALTEMLEGVIRNRSQFDVIEADWEVLRSTIKEERQGYTPVVNDYSKWLEELNETELRTLLSKVPTHTLKRIREAQV
jgi:hypothetical protein